VNRGLATIVILSLMGGTAYYANKDGPPVTPIAKPSPLTTSEEDANTVVAAGQLNEQWEKSFDKAGKYPEKQDPSAHYFVLGSLVRILPDSPSYQAAQALREKFSARQVKINAVEKAKRPPDPELPKLTLDRIDSSYGLAKADFRIANGNVFAIADVQIKCEVFAASGTSLRLYDLTVFDVIQPKTTKTIREFKVGFWPDQGKSMSCSPLIYKRR
jgi:hypothetical protein